MRLPPGLTRSRRFALGWASIAVVWLTAAGPTGTPVDYNRDVRPILAKNCFACHGKDESHRERGLRLDDREAASNELKSGAIALVPGSPDESELILRLTEEDESLRMPPRKTGERLSKSDVETLRRWVKEGATYAEHWSLVKPVDRTLPHAKDRDWCRNGLDYWVVQRLEKEGIAPAPEADKFTLLRRASLDLRGLPPTIKEIDAFTADTSSDAYEKVVAKFLDDPAFGERWARHWLDLARYADSAGYGSDPLRTIWKYRDWVIDAFNQNKPFDVFTVEQIAGDLLPNATIEQKIATAFHRNTMTNTEGGTDDEEFRVAAIKDRVDSTGQVWMGLTVGCAKCHTHKYDPITHEDYYRFYAIFDQTADSDKPDESPLLSIPTPEETAKNREIDVKTAALTTKLNATTPELTQAQESWEKERAANAPTEAKSDKKDKKTEPPADVVKALTVAAEKRSPQERDAVAAYYRTIAPLLKPIRDEVAALEKSRPQIATVPVMVELASDKRRVTHLLEKGNFLSPGKVLTPGVLSALHPLPSGAPSDRLGLARWLVSPENPLTARVVVNRYWAQLFGAGIVETEEDFGTQGEPPSHPELLDWLAREYMRNGWDTKAFLRMVMTSAAYRQSSRVTPEKLAKDPRNRLFSRGPRFRLEAEMVRDQALALCGLLSHKMHGPSVFPPQPEGLWQAAFNGQRTWSTSAGEDKHRRGIYTFWRRTVPYPSMATFDAPSREICSVRRTRTNTPLQAFVTLNDPVYVEAAQSLARRIVSEGGASPQERAKFALKLCLSRPAAEEQVERLVGLFKSEREHYSKHPADAVALATEPLGPLPKGMDAADLAAWTTVANVLLNLDGVLTKG